MRIHIRKDIPVKYECNAHRLMLGYPGRDDVLFDMIKHVLLKKKRRKTFGIEEFTLPIDEIRELYKDLPAESMSKVKESLQEMDKSELIRRDEKNVRISRDALTMFYEITDN